MQLLEVNFTRGDGVVSEDGGSVAVCVALTGLIDRNVTVELMTVEATASKYRIHYWGRMLENNGLRSTGRGGGGGNT